MTSHQFKHPFSCLIAGPSQCGKTTFVERLIKHHNEMIFPHLTEIIWHYAEFQEIYTWLAQNVSFKQGTPTEEQLKSYGGLLFCIGGA